LIKKVNFLFASYNIRDSEETKLDKGQVTSILVKNTSPDDIGAISVETELFFVEYGMPETLYISLKEFSIF